MGREAWGLEGGRVFCVGGRVFCVRGCCCAPGMRCNDNKAQIVGAVRVAGGRRGREWAEPIGPVRKAFSLCQRPFCLWRAGRQVAVEGAGRADWCCSQGIWPVAGGEASRS